MTRITGILFDKDGTLFDFHTTWGNWTAGLVNELAGGDPAQAALLADRIGYELDRRQFRRDSIVIASTPPEIADALLPALPGWDKDALIDLMNTRAAAAPQAEAVPLAPLLTRLRQRGLRLGVATNDAEGPARAHLRAAGVEDAFDFIAGSDSGHGAKPGPGMVLAFARALGLDLAEVLMVGDSRHDLAAGQAAGCRKLAVLTGPALAGDLAPFADAVLPDIGRLPGWLDQIEAAA